MERGSWREAVARDIDHNGGLIVEYKGEDGELLRRTLHTGEITLRVL